MWGSLTSANLVANIPSEVWPADVQLSKQPPNVKHSNVVSIEYMVINFQICAPPPLPFSSFN